MPFFQATDLRFRYPDAVDDVLRIPDLKIECGEFVSLVGASGSGKSTLLRLLADLRTPSSGDLQRADGRMGMVFQSPNLVRWRTARANVQLPTELGPRSSDVADDRIAELFELVGFREEDTYKRPAELSGGMQMRVALARSLVLQPSALLLDEPFAALDDVLRMQLEEDVRRIHDERGLTTVLVTHNIHEAVFMSDTVMILGESPSRIVAEVFVGDYVRDREFRRKRQFHELIDEVSDQLCSVAVGASP